MASSEKSPKDPAECVKWANARLRRPDEHHWVVTGDPMRPIALVPGPVPLQVSNYE